MKKVLLIVLCFAVLMTCYSHAFAENGKEIRISLIRAEEEVGITQKLVIEGGWDPLLIHKRISVSVLRPGIMPETPLSENLSFADKFAIFHIFYVDDENQSFSLPFNLKEGEYTVCINSSESLLSEKIYCYPIDTLAKLLSDLNSEEGIDENELSVLLYEEGEKLGIDTSLLSKASGETVKKIARKILEEEKETYTFSIFEQLVYKHLMVQGLINENSFELKNGIIEKYGKELKVEEIRVWESYLDMDDGLKEKALSYAHGKTAENEEALRELIEDGIAFSAFKALGNKSLVDGYLSEYGEILENADIDGFNSLSSRKKDVVAKNIIRNMNKPESLEEIEALINSSVKNADALLPAPSGGSGGGGGGGASAPASKVKVDNTISKPVTEPFEEREAETSFFSDIEDVKWAEKSIEFLLEKGIVNGREANRFCPNEPVKRSEFVKMIAEAFGYEEEKGIGFNDVSGDYWANKYISAVAGAGLIKGDTAGNFNPESNITRQDIATILYRVLVIENHKFNVDSVKMKFSDHEEIGKYAFNGIAMLSEMGILNGYEDNTIRPTRTATRAETAVLVEKVIRLLEKEV